MALESDVPAGARAGTVRVVIVEDDPSHRERFRDHLRLDDRLELVGEFANATSAMTAIPG